MPRLGRAGAAGDDERRERDDCRAGSKDPRVARQHGEPGRRGDEHGGEDREARAEVPGRLPDVLDDVEPAAGRNARIEPSCEHEVG